MTGIYNTINGVNCSIILTTAPNDSAAPIHDRMPLMLSHEQVRPWLVDAGAAPELLCSCAALPAPQRWALSPFEDVTADCAAAEVDGTLAAWKKAHRKAFAAACEKIGRNFDESMKCVCEYFDVVYRADGQ